MNNQLLTTKQAASILSVSEDFLARDRWAGAKIPFIKLGSRAVRYRQEDIEDFINSRRMKSTSEHQVSKLAART